MCRVLQSQELGLLEHQHVVGRQKSTQLRREFLSMLGVVGKGRWIVRNDAGAGDLNDARDAVVVGEGGRWWRDVGEIERVLKDIGRGWVERAGGWEWRWGGEGGAFSGWRRGWRREERGAG